MREPRIIRAMDQLDDELISEALKRGNKMAKTNNIFLRWGALAAAFVLLLGCAVMLSQFIASGTPSAVIALDVNPSLEIEVNKNEKVIQVNALNADAIKVIGEMELGGVGLDVAINALIGSMLRNGYLTADQNSILISVDSDDAERASLLRESLSADISAILSGNNINASVLTQTFNRETEQTEAGASAAVSALADKILAAGLKNAHGVPYTREELTGMKINDLKLILESKELNVDGLTHSGNAGTGKYIGRDTALSLALASLNADRESIRELDIELDYDSRLKAMVYEIEFNSGKTEYEFMIHAVSGEILERKTETDDDVITPSVEISEKDALTIALRDADLTKESVRDLETELEGGLWNIEFETADTEYEYKIDAKSGEIKHKDTEQKRIDPPVTDPPVTNPPAPEKLSMEEALEVALRDAGLTKTNVRDIDIELENGVWSVDFETDGIEYEYKIDPASGAVLQKHTETRDRDGETTVPPSSSVTKESALASALADAGLTREQVRDIDIELDDGVWNVEFETKTYSYEYKIDPKTGKIIDKEIEKED